MDSHYLIQQIIQLEKNLAQSQNDVYSIRKHLEQFSAPAPSGDSYQSKERLIRMLNKRKKVFYKTNKK